MLVALTAMAHKGDGTLTDKGARTAHSRFELDLGSIDLERTGRREYQFSDLPHEEFTFGLRLKAPTGEKLSHLPKATVRMTLTNEQGQVVFEVAEELTNWVRSEKESEWFLYMRGVQKQTPGAASRVTMERIAFGPDGGWGTYVSPRTEGTYKLVVETVKPDVRLSKFIAQLVGVGGGWK